MNIKIPFGCLTSVLLFASGLYPTAQADEAGIGELKTAYAAALAAIEEPHRVLLVKYRESLQALLERQRAAGNLEAVLATTKEMESATSAAPRDFSAQPDLKRLRDIYDKALQRIRTSTVADLDRLNESYREQALSRVESLTRAGRIDEAKEVNAWLEELQERPSSTVGTEGGAKVLWELKSRAGIEAVGGCEMKVGKAGFELTSERGGGNAWMKSRQEFSPPFRIVTRVATDSTNIRLYYRSHLAILNWEVNPSELRIHHPDGSGGVGFAGKGQVPRNRMQDVEIDVLPDKVTVKVDGRLRGELLAASTGLKGPVGIGPAFGSTVTVESFRVLALE